MGAFDAIRPYADTEVRPVLARLLADPAFLGTLTRFRFPRLAGPLGWLLKPLIAARLRSEFASVDSVTRLQEKIEPYIDRTIEHASDGISYSGLEHLQSGKPYLYLAKHAQGLAFEFDDGVIQQAELAGLLPATRRDIALVIGQARGQCQEQHQRVLGYRGGAVALAVADGHAMGLGGAQVDVVGTGGGDQDQSQIRAGVECGGVQRHLVADGDLCTLQAFGDLIRRRMGVQGQLGEGLLHRLHVEVAEVEGSMVEEDGAWAVAHQLYLFAGG